MFVQLDVDFFGFGGCSVLDTDCSILQLGGLYTFIASDLWSERCLISMSSNPELNNNTFVFKTFPAPIRGAVSYIM